MATTADATADLLRSLDDPSKFERVPGVPVFQAHTREFPEQRLPDGTVVPARTVTVTEADLYQIAARLNASIAATGHLPPLTEGHRRFDPAFPEKDQPRLLGFGKNYRVDWVARDRERFLAILEDEYVKVGCRAALGQYPYRSLEYDADGRIGEGTAFLIRPPFFKMGTTCLYQATEATMAGEAKPGGEWTDEDTKAYASWQKYMQKYTAEGAGGAMGAGNAAPPATVPPPPPAGYQAPGVTMLYVTPDGRVSPTPPAGFQPPAAPPAGQPTPAAYAADLARLSAEQAGLRQQLDAERAARTQAECRSMLDPLRNLVTFSYEAELGRLVALPDAAARAGHVKYMADHYGRLPSGGFIPVYQGNDHMPQPAAPGAGPAAPKNYQAIVAYMTARPGTTYDQAEAAVAAAK